MDDLADIVTADDVRRFVLALPDTSERSMYGWPGFYVGKKAFARIREEGDVLVVWTASLEDKEALLATDRAALFTLPHYDGHPSILVRLGIVNADELEELLADAWRVRAPKTLRAEFDAQFE